MPRVDVVVETAVSRSPRARQLEGMFDVPSKERQRLEWHADLPIDDEPWNVGLIVGPSGAGKTTVARSLFGDAVDSKIAWGGASVIDDFDASLSMQDISEACSAVGFNTIPAWLRPYSVLSNGERFRVELARRVLELPDPIVVDEFTSVVDRQVAQIGSHSVQKMIRKRGRKFIAVSCHYDVIDWLQPDWIFEPANGQFARRSLQRRPALDVTVSRLPYPAWRIFAPFHYLTAELHRAARCFGLWVGDRLAAFAGVLHRPHPTAKNIKGLSRLVTLPDWQGLGLAFVLSDALGGAYRAIGQRFRMYPAHPALVRSFDRSKVWALMKRPGAFSSRAGDSSTARMGGRPCAVFEFVGPALKAADARRLLGV